MKGRTPAIKVIKSFLLGFLGSIVIRLLLGTVRIEEIPDKHPGKLKQQDKNVIFSIWHSCMLIPIYVGRGLGIKALISRHTDGEYIAQAVKWLGFSIVRGSTTRGGVNALLGLIRNTKTGISLAVTPDGPRGPRLIVQSGIIFLGQKTNYSIIPAGVGLTSYWELPSWDGFRIPKPFSRAVMIYGEPVEIPSELDKAGTEKYRLLLENTMNDMMAEAERLVKGRENLSIE